MQHQSYHTLLEREETNFTNSVQISWDDHKNSEGSKELMIVFDNSIERDDLSQDLESWFFNDYIFCLSTKQSLDLSIQKNE